MKSKNLLFKNLVLIIFFAFTSINQLHARTTNHKGATTHSAPIGTPFITRWDLSKSTGSGTTQISFGVETSGTVSYTWATVPAGSTGSGTFSGTTATIMGLPANATINLSIDPTNFQRIKISGSMDVSRLTELRQWGTVAWTSMQNAFYGCNNFTLTATDIPILTGVTNMSGMFGSCSSFNRALPEGFDTSNVTDMSFMFNECTAYNQALPSTFNTTAVKDMSYMFIGCSVFNQALPANFNTAAVTNMSYMFYGCVAYNQALPSTFNTAAVKNMRYMFYGCTAYNQALPANFNTAAVTNMSAMFSSCSTYNQALPANFNTAAVTNMGGMFANCRAYNQALPANFNTAAVTDMSYMFYNCTAFDQNVGNFNLTAATNMTNIFQFSGISITNYDRILTAWNTAGYTNKNLGSASPLKYCASAADRANLVKAIANGGKGWTISGDVLCTTTTLASSLNPSTSGSNVTFTATVSPTAATGTVTFKDGATTLGTGTLSAGMATFSTTALSAATHSITAVYNGNTTNAVSTSAALSQVVNVDPNSLFITRWDLSKSTGSGATQISFGVETSGVVNYTWQQVGGTGLSGSGTFTGITATITGLPTGGVIDLTINPTNFQRINISQGTDRSRLTQLKQWGTVAWTSMQNAFYGCNNFTLVATDVPILTGVTNMNQMFMECENFNQALPEGFNTATVTDMGGMFQSCSIYNQPLPNNFNTAAVTNMGYMFAYCSAFNRVLSNNFDTGKVTNMGGMFYLCSAYNQILPSSFNTVAATNMTQMFYNCSVYNQKLPDNFNTAAVTNMSYMFYGCSAYNQPLPNNFSTTKVIEIRSMFQNCTVFNQNIGNFNIAAVAFMSNIFNGSGISITNYDAILTAWNTAGYTNKDLGNASPLKYCASAADRANLVKTIANGGRGWTITGDTYDNSCIGTPAPTGAASQTFCAGKTVADLVATGTNIKWYDANTGGNLLPTNTVLVNGIVYYATQTVSGVESTNRLAVTVTVNALPTLNPGSNSPVCVGNTINLFSVKDKLLVNSGGPPPQTYAWTGPNSFNSTLENPSIPSATLLASGTYQLTVRSFEGCTASATTSVTVNALPVLNPSSNSPVCSGQTLSLYAKGMNAPGDNDSYVWAGVNNFTANTQNPNIGNVTLTANGIYTVSATNSANCSATATVLVTVKQTPTLVISNFTNPTPENNPDGTISFTTNLPNGNFALSYSSTGSPKDVMVANGAFTLGGLVSGVYANFAVTNDGCTGRNNTEVRLLSTPFTLVKSIASGNWESSTTWNVGRVPKAGDVVIVDTGHTVTVNANGNVKDVEVRGQLIYGVVGIVINLGL